MMKGINKNNDVQGVKIDKLTSYLVALTGDHSEIHDGSAFSANYFISALASSGTFKISLTTPATKYVHFRPVNISTSGDKVTVNVYETPTITVAGTLVASANRNRNSSAVAGTVIKQGVTATANGTIIDTVYLGGGTGIGQTVSGSSLNQDNEIVLKPSTAYIIEVVNGSAAANNIMVKVLFYEEEEGA